jgi:uncharacterized protein DUF4928
MKVNCDPLEAPHVWVSSILAAVGASNDTIRDLVRVKLEHRFSADRLRSEVGTSDPQIDFTCYQVTLFPRSVDLNKCAANIRRGLHPVLLVPRGQLVRARRLMKQIRLEKHISLFGIESFIGLNVLNMAESMQRDVFATFQAIVVDYNRRFALRETGSALNIEIVQSVDGCSRNTRSQKNISRKHRRR